MIHETVERDVHGGLMQLNAVVLSLLRDWVLDVAEMELKKRRDTSHPDTLRFMANLAELYNHQGIYDKAEPLYAECLEKRTAVLGTRTLIKIL
mmetsp:Transcript_10632/g.14642  ORF Transcript_10632/g.14642 Transcript_10632/m.14642 type:complete len:93 (+) Transcript_10632:27-305(+)